MKKTDFTNVLVKSKMTGYEVGRLMIQSFLYDLKQLSQGVEKIQDLLSTKEVQYVQEQLTDSNDIKIYNSCRRLWEYIMNASRVAEVTKKEIEIISLKLYFLISGEIKADSLRHWLSVKITKGEITLPDSNAESIIELMDADIFDSKDKMVSDLYDDFVNRLKLWLELQEVFKLISDRMELPDIMILIGSEPMNQVNLVNALISDLQFLHPHNSISKTLADKGIGHIYEADEVLKEDGIIEIDKLKPKAERIDAAREAIKDLTYFKNNYGLNSILEGEGLR